MNCEKQKKCTLQALTNKTKEDYMYTAEQTQKQHYLFKLSFYNIKTNECDIDTITGLHFIDAIQLWEKQLKKALELGVNWIISNYNPNGLEQAVLSYEEAMDAKYRTKALEYGIKFDKNDWCIDTYGHVIDVVKDWEALVAQARDEHGIYWNIEDYDYEHLQYLISGGFNHKRNY